MTFRPMLLACECGLPAVRIKSVGFTTEYELVVHWRCMACGKPAYIVKSLADCCRECPETEDVATEPIGELGHDLQSEDARFLQSLGICFAEDAKPEPR